MGFTLRLIKINVKLQYFTEIREFITVMAVVKNLYTKDGEEFLVLSTGDEIRLDRIVRIDEVTSPTYSHIDDYTCDC